MQKWIITIILYIWAQNNHYPLILVFPFSSSKWSRDDALFMFLICKDTNQVGKSVANLVRMLFVVTSFLNSKLSFLFWIGNISHYNDDNELQIWTSNTRCFILPNISFPCVQECRNNLAIINMQRAFCYNIYAYSYLILKKWKMLNGK